MVGGSSEKPSAGAGLRVRAPLELAAGVFLVVVALIALWAGSDLPLGTMRSMGAGMLPRSLAVLVAFAGVAVIVTAFVTDGADLGKWPLRGPLFILGAVLIFALTIRTLGLAFAGPLAMIFGSFASDEVRWKETIIFSVCLTGACILLFKVLLGLPIPVIAFI
jgi:putative tricarboxylic transport membrane protein